MSQVKIFLLTPTDKELTKIIWADSEYFARFIADDNYIKIVESGDTLPQTKSGIYSKSDSICEEITSQITNIRQFDLTNIHFKYQEKQIALGKDKPEFLKKYK
jgi:hypothetical protein